MTRHHYPIPLMQASHESTTLSALIKRAEDSGARLKSIEKLLPYELKKHIHPGPIEGTEWCLIADNSTVSAKLRQILPTIRAHLISQGWEITTIRIKVKTNETKNNNK